MTPIQHLKRIVLFAAAVCFHVSAVAQPQSGSPLAASIPSSYNVSSSGAFSFNVPIDIPPGIRNVVPHLSISYNSQGSSGMLGIGWNISGLSSITRALPSIHHNRFMGPVDFNNDDVFVLDGQRLFEDPQNAGIYLSESKNFSKITSFGTAGSGPSYFTVLTPDGMIYEYGNTASSKMYGVGRPEVMIWALDKISDQMGNYVSFDYVNDYTNGEYRVTSIKYTGLQTYVAPPGEIVFNYIPKTDVNETWIAGSPVKDAWLLDNISVTYNALMVNKYQFNYDVDEYTHLKTIVNTRCDAAGCSDLPPIIINWGKEDLAYTTPDADIHNTSVSNPYPYNYAIGDFNGDGLTDFVRTPTNPTNQPNQP